MSEEEKSTKSKKIGGMPLRDTLILSFSLLCILAAGAYFTGIYDRLQEDALVDQKYEAWRQTLSPERQDWETHCKTQLVLTIGRSISATAWQEKETCWDYADSKPGLPTVFVIGDSISLGYTPVVRKNLKGKVNVERVPENCGKVSHALGSIDKWLGAKHYKLIYFNFGIHDRRTPLATYQKELQALVQKLKPHADIIVFASSTPLPQDPSKEMDNLDILEKNRVAREVMKENQIPVDDLYAFVEPNKHELMEENDCHFQSAGYVALGNHATETIKSCLKSITNKTKRALETAVDHQGDTNLGDCAAGQLNTTKSFAIDFRSLTWRNGGDQSDNSKVFIEENHIDGITHAEHMNTAAWSNKEPFAAGQLICTQ